MSNPTDKSLFIHSFIDDYGFTASQFRVLCHLARREGANGAYPSIPLIASICRLNVKTVYAALKILKQHKVIRVMPRPGTSSLYHINPFFEWAPPVRTAPKRRRRGPPTADPAHSSQNEPDEGSPNKGNPLKENLSDVVLSELEKEFVQTWNGQPTLRPIQNLSANERSLLRLRCAQTCFRDHWKEALLKMAKLDFCTGRTTHKFHASVGWLLKEPTVQEILEGKFDPRGESLNTLLSLQKFLKEKLKRSEENDKYSSEWRELNKQLEQVESRIHARANEI